MRLKTLMTVGGLSIALAMILAGIGLGGWHFWRYVVAPTFGWVDERGIWDENVRVATSPFRRIEEKEQALDRLLQMREFAATLTDGERQSTAEKLQDVVFLEGAPLDLQFRAARVQQMLRGENVSPAQHTAAAPTEVEKGDDDARERLLEMLKAARRQSRTDLQKQSPDRTRLLVTVMRSHPCDNELLEAVDRLLERNDLPTVERSFLFAVRHNAEETCS